MVITEAQYKSILARLTALEMTMNDVLTAMNSFITLDQVQELLVLSKTDVDQFKTQLESFEARLIAIEEEPLD